MQIKTDTFLISIEGNKSYASIHTDLSQYAIDVLHQLITQGIKTLHGEEFSFNDCSNQLGLDLINEFEYQIEFKMVDTLFHLFFYEYNGCYLQPGSDDDIFIRMRWGWENE